MLHFTDNFISWDVYLFRGRQRLWWLRNIIANIVRDYKPLQTIKIVVWTILKDETLSLYSKRKNMESLYF